MSGASVRFGHGSSELKFNKPVLKAPMYIVCTYSGEDLLTKLQST